MQINWNYFQMRTILNCPGATKRWGNCVNECERVGLNAIRFAAIPGRDQFESFNLSVKAILQAFLSGKSESLLFLEDDVKFKHPLDMQHVNAAIGELPENWDVLYLGANLLTNEVVHKPERYSDHLYRVKQAWTTHAVAFSRRAARLMVDNMPVEPGTMADSWLSSNLKDLKAFVIAPMIAYQRPDYSSLWLCDTNYTDIFVQSEKLFHQ